MIADALTWLVQGAVASTAALLCVLVLRAPARALFGARVAYGLWMLVPAALLAVSLPGPAMEFAARGVQGVATGAVPSVRVGLATALQPVTSMVSSPSVIAPGMLALLWACGALAMALWSWRLQHRFVSALGPLALRGDGLFTAESTSTSPAVIGAWRSRIVLPADFDARYPAEEGALVIAHEREHVRRRDVRINLFVVVLRCLHWFNPLLHWAAARFRFDQELACDAAVLAAHPDSRRAYAGAMLKTQLAVLGLPVGCHWQSSQSLKERILMLKKPQPGSLRRRVGIVAVAAVLVVSSYGVWALQPAVATQAPVYVGKSLQGSVIFADIIAKPDTSTLFVSSGGMSNGPNGMTRIHMPSGEQLVLGFGSSDPTKTLKLTANASGSSDSPRLNWKLEKAGREINSGVAVLDSGKPSTVVMGGPAHGTEASATLHFSSARDGLLTGGFDTPGPRLLRGEDGVFVNPRGGVYSSAFKASGTADLLLQVSEQGDVTGVTVESSTPPSVFTATEARSFVEGWKYTPMLQDGKPVASQIRVTVEFGSRPPTWPEASTEQPASSTPAPQYPAEALANKQRGQVLLHLLVATDGSVKDVRVVDSDPKGMFDAVSIEAAKKWKLQPQIKDGKPVEGWLQVPITFEPDRKPAAPRADATAKKV